MKKTIAALLILLAVLTVLCSCGKKPDYAENPNAVLTDSDVPLDLGAEVQFAETQSDAR